MFRLILALSSLFVASPAFGHGGQPSFEKQVGSYIVDIGYDRIGFRPGEDVTFDFNLFTGTGGVAAGFADFSRVRVEMSRDGITVLDTVVANDQEEAPVLMYAFPQEGRYVLHATFINGGDTLAYATFDMPVGEYNGTLGRALNILTYVVAAALGIFAVYVIAGSIRRR